ncbi:MAG: hypothetical protein CVU01_01245 [Bacteroidetes bacterium HGW-Bacteroidetes-18]|nr:MAG: hypothetical protein CVU01_01245 [Bacteroidetes bacterium HGW-Bacteroidetes-18]
MPKENKILNAFKKLLGIHPKLTSDEFINKFMEDVNYKHVQMEVYFDERVILMIDSLSHVPIWIERGKISEKIYKNGFVIFFFFNKKQINRNNYYKNYLNSKEQLEMVEYEGKINLIYLHFFDKNATSIEIGDYMLKIINMVYKISSKDSQILFNLRYLKTS